MKTVLVYRNDLLPWSETFIKEQILALRRWRGVLIGMRQLHQLSLEGLELCILRPEKRTFANRLHWRLSRSLGMVSPAIRRLRREHPSLLHVHFGVNALPPGLLQKHSMFRCWSRFMDTTSTPVGSGGKRATGDRRWQIILRGS